MNRCGWAGTDPLMIKYHDEEWGIPVHEDRTLFEFLILEGAQAGLTWATILNKREGYRKAFDGFDCKKISKYGEKKIKSLINNAGIVRNKLKINSAVRNAKVFLQIQKEFGSFDKYIWGFTGKQLKTNAKSFRELPPETEISGKISKDLKQRGMNFVGSTIIYAFMQAVGITNDHEISCFRR